MLGIMIGMAGGILIWSASRRRPFREAMEQTERLRSENLVLQERMKDRSEELQQLRELMSRETARFTELTGELAREKESGRNLQERLNVQKEEIGQLQKKFTLEFENIANKILKENSREFNILSQKNVGDILNPLKEKITRFEKQVQDTYEKGLQDRTALRHQLSQLMDLNVKLSEEATHLTKALKSDSKKMGNWGELILDKILEQSGLIKGREYETQYTDRNEQGELIRPDVIIHLPEEKHIVIDSKVSLLAYDSYVNEEDALLRDKFLKAHIESIRNHVKGLHEKGYQGAGNLDTPDFVLLFMPMESAFSAAIQSDAELFQFAWERKIVIVSPTTLLATLKTVASIWKHEKQTQNAMEIAKQGGSLYDKFVGFVDDLEKVGNQINSLQKTYDDAQKKLSTGRGNLIRKAEQLKELGVKTEKSITGKYLTHDEE